MAVDETPALGGICEARNYLFRHSGDLAATGAMPLERALSNQRALQNTNNQACEPDGNVGRRALAKCRIAPIALIGRVSLAMRQGSWPLSPRCPPNDSGSFCSPWGSCPPSGCFVLRERWSFCASAERRTPSRLRPFCLYQRLSGRTDPMEIPMETNLPPIFPSQCGSSLVLVSAPAAPSIPHSPSRVFAVLSVVVDLAMLIMEYLEVRRREGSARKARVASDPRNTAREYVRLAKTGRFLLLAWPLNV